jgi:hypothetical protein
MRGSVSRHLLFCWGMIFPENRFPLFGIMPCARVEPERGQTG